MVLLGVRPSRPAVYNKRRGNYPQNADYCGRGSIAGNPFVIGIDGDRDEVCDKYEQWAPQQDWFEDFIERIRGRDLLCFCAPKRCHCDFLLRRANEC